MSKTAHEIPLEEIAGDAVALIEAFREKGSVSFQHGTPAQAREAYRLNCATNKLEVTEPLEIKDIACPVDGGAIKLRFYRQSKGGNQPLLLFLHGGGWVIGDIDTHDSICRFLAVHSGCIVVSVDYRLAPEYRFPVPYLDCLTALNWLADNESRFGLNCRKTFIVGDSAGGGMSTILANDPAISSKITITGQVLLYPVTDMTASAPSYKQITSGVPLTDKTMDWFINHYVASGTDLKERRLSPLFHGAHQQADMFIVTVGYDPLRDEGIDYAGLAAKHGTRVEHHHLPQHMHGIFNALGKVKTAEILLAKAASFIQNRL